MWESRSLDIFLIKVSGQIRNEPGDMAKNTPGDIANQYIYIYTSIYIHPEILGINGHGHTRSNESVSLDIFGICCAFAINEPLASIHLESTSLGDDTTQGHCTTTTRRRRSQNSSRRARARPTTRCLVEVREILTGYLLSGCSDCLESSLSSSCACAWCHAPPPPYV
jgi:hypothetical protein